MHSCTLPESVCGSLFTFKEIIDPNTDLYKDSQTKELNWGITNFDNIGSAFLTVFQVTTLEGWTPIMYVISDGYNVYVSSIYFCFCVLVCSYFLLNLTIAVMLDKF